MPKRSTHPLLQVLFEPFPNPTSDGYTWNREGGEAFAGTYFFDALDATGALKERGYRAVVQGCSGCRRSDDDSRAHWDTRNDNPGPFAPKKIRRCARWKMVEAIVKSFGGWKRTHYVELPEYEGLRFQPIPQRRRMIEPCPVCKGKGFTDWDITAKDFTECDAGCRSYGYGTRGEVQITYEGPVRPDRHDMTPVQRRMRA